MTKHLTKPVYFYDNNGYKIGPVRKRDLIAFAENGTINPETRITDDKIEVRAKQIPNLKFCAPEYRKAEEMFDPENIDFDSMPLAVEPEPMVRQVRENNRQTTVPNAIPQHDSYKTDICPGSSNPAPIHDQLVNEFSKLTYHPMVIVAIVLLAITAVTSTATCYIVVSTALAFAQFGKELRELGEAPRNAKFNAPELPELPDIEFPEMPPVREFRAPELNFEPRRVEVPQRIPDKMNTLRDEFERKLGFNLLVEMMQPKLPAEELQRGVRVPQRNVPPPQRLNR